MERGKDGRMQNWTQIVKRKNLPYLHASRVELRPRNKNGNSDEIRHALSFWSKLIFKKSLNLNKERVNEFRSSAFYIIEYTPIEDLHPTYIQKRDNACHPGWNAYKHFSQDDSKYFGDLLWLGIRPLSFDTPLWLGVGERRGGEENEEGDGMKEKDKK